MRLFVLMVMTIFNGTTALSFGQGHSGELAILIDERIAKVMQFEPFAEWKCHFFNNDSALRFESARTMNLGGGPRVKIDGFKECPSDPAGRYFLIMRFGFLLTEDSENKRIFFAEPDSFLFLFDAREEHLFQLASMGPLGRFHNVFWLDKEIILLVGLGNEIGVVQLFDLDDNKAYLFFIDGPCGCSREDELSYLESVLDERRLNCVIGHGPNEN